MPKLGIDETESKIIIALLVFTILYLGFAQSFITDSQWFKNLNPVFAYILFNLGWVSLFVLTFGTIFSYLLEKAYNLKEAFLTGITSWFSFSFFIDMYQPPFYLDRLGNTIISNEGTAVNASVDAMWAYVINSLIPAAKTITIPFFDGNLLAQGSLPVTNTSLLWILVYGIVPILSIVVAALILTKGEFIKFVSILAHRKART